MARKLALLLAVLLLSGIAVAQGAAPKTKAKPAAQGAAADQAIMEKEKQLWDAWKNYDAAPFKESLTDNMVFVDENGITGKSQFLDDLSKKPCQVKNVSLTDMKVTTFDSNTAAVAYKADVDGTCNGQPIAPSYATSVYTRRAGKWMVAVHQASNVKK